VTAFEATHLGGVLALCTAEGWPTFPSDPHRALRALLAAGATTVVALDVDGEVIGFAHALSDGVTIYLAELLVAPAHRHRGIGRRLVSELLDRCDAVRMDLITDSAEAFYASLPHRRYAGFRLYPSSGWAAEDRQR
jgi:GNAT superfamily N-acetyltransferase